MIESINDCECDVLKLRLPRGICIRESVNVGCVFLDIHVAFSMIMYQL